MLGFITRVAMAVAVLLILLIAAVTAIVYFAYAVYLLLAAFVIAPAAAALTGIVVLAGAILLIVALGAAVRPKRPKEKDERSPAMDGYDTAAEVGSLLGRRTRGLLEAHSRGGLVAMLLAGFAVGFSPKLRAVLRELLKW